MLLGAMLVGFVSCDEEEPKVDNKGNGTEQTDPDGTGSGGGTTNPTTPTYAITLSVNDEAMGEVTGGGTYKKGETVTLIATANEGYKFVKWSDDETENPRTITITADVTLSALFETAETTTPTFENQTLTVDGVEFTMVAVEGGTFTMGATSEQGTDDPWDDEYPTHEVTLSDYYIGETEVTQGLWEAVMGYTPTESGSQWSSSYGLGDDYPAYYISWNDCQSFITKLNELTGKTFRMPTEAEWEYAARGGNKSQGYKYSGSNTIGNVAWYSSNSNSTTHSVKGKVANELGIYDMSGNVYEWCSDWYGDYSADAQTNPTGAESGSYRVFRGGDWNYDARVCRVSDRCDIGPSYRNYDGGLRLVLLP